jgi:hypothetical protein
MFDRIVANKLTTGWQCANPAIASFFLGISRRFAPRSTPEDRDARTDGAAL